MIWIILAILDQSRVRCVDNVSEMFLLVHNRRAPAIIVVE
jgi:hypothetical protein